MEPEKDKNLSTSDTESKNLVVLKMFEKDTRLVFAYKKSEKIAAALYLVSNLLPDGEFLKQELRKGGVNLVNKILSFNADPLSETSAMLLPDIMRVSSLLEIASVAGLVSRMNCIIIKRELETLLEPLSQRIVDSPKKRTDTSFLDERFFEVAEKETFSPRKTLPQNQPIKDSADFIQTPQRILGERKPARQNESVGSMERENMIKELLKVKSNLTIRDFVPVIKGCSEKTIQRELLRLVKRGVLKKEGERRWSRYSLVS